MYFAEAGEVIQMLKRFRKKNAPSLPFKESFGWNWRQTHFNRIALVNLLCASKLGGSYLEIGCQGNVLFDSVPMLDKTGVDPAEGGTHQEYSDDFFLKNTKLYDVIFIDGLHIYDQVHRDVVNSIKCLKPGGWIALHDMLPDNAISEHVPNISQAEWCGDVWKVAFELISSNSIDFKLIRIDSGVGLIKVTNPDALVSDLKDELQDQRFEYLYKNISRLPLISWEEAYAWIRTNS